MQELQQLTEESEENSSHSRSNNHNDDSGNAEHDRRYRYNFMIANEVPYVMAKAAEMFIRDITTRAWIHTDNNRRKTIQKPDIIHATSDTEMYDFLIDVIPHLTDVSNTNNSNTSTSATTATSSAAPNTTHNYYTTTAATSTPVMYDMSLFNTNSLIQHQAPTTTTQLPSARTDVPSEPPIPPAATQPAVPEQQQQDTIKNFPASYSTTLMMENHEPINHDNTNQVPLPPTPLTTHNMIFSPLSTSTETMQQPTHHHHDLDETPHTDHQEDLHQDEQEQQHSTSNYYDTSSSPPQNWTLE